jgi:D-methionine transport system substrate-binding protein
MCLALLLAGCGSAQQGGSPEGVATTTAATAQTPAGNTSLKVGATPAPHAEILRYVAENLAPKEGLTIEVVEFTDYVLPNMALNDKEIDANYFQHVPYMEDFGEQRGIDMVAVADVHVEPLGIYSRKVKSLEEVPEGAVVTIPNDATNGGRALLLLAANNLITLREGAGTTTTVRDITGNPRQLEITELEAAQLPRALDDATLSVINGNYALEADLQPDRDALALESGENNPYANVLAVLRGRENEPAIQTLARLLTSPEVKQFIQDRYKGSVIPAF